jgi:hypothetical protein
MNEDMMDIKILCYRNPVCYSVWRVVQAVVIELTPQFPQVDFELNMIRDSTEIARYTQHLVLPSLVINGKLVCSGYIPARKEVLAWLQTALAANDHAPVAMREG